MINPGQGLVPPCPQAQQMCLVWPLPQVQVCPEDAEQSRGPSKTSLLSWFQLSHGHQGLLCPQAIQEGWNTWGDSQHHRHFCPTPVPQTPPAMCPWHGSNNPRRAGSLAPKASKSMSILTTRVPTDGGTSPRGCRWPVPPSRALPCLRPPSSTCASA